MAAPIEQQEAFGLHRDAGFFLPDNREPKPYLSLRDRFETARSRADRSRSHRRDEGRGITRPAQSAAAEGRGHRSARARVQCLTEGGGTPRLLLREGS